MAEQDDKSQRQQQILDVMSRNQVTSQVELLDLLLAEGVRTTQSTLSRDLREMGIIKGHSGYRLPSRDETGAGRLQALARAVGPRLVNVDWGGNLVVLTCAEAGEAREIADRVGRARLHQAAGAVPCEGAVLVVARSQAYARELVRALREKPRRARRRRLLG
jgi:transcriptional regulator of arginine metabolism